MRFGFIAWTFALICLALQTVSAEVGDSSETRARAASEISQGVARMEASRQEIVAKNLTLNASKTKVADYQQCPTTRTIEDMHRFAELVRVVERAVEAEAFWPVYREYRFEVGELQDRNTKLILDYAEVYQAMDAAAAKPLLKEWFSIRKDELKIKDKYRSKLEKVLPADKALRFFQIDNRLDLAAKMKLAEQLPLVE